MKLSLKMLASIAGVLSVNASAAFAASMAAAPAQASTQQVATVPVAATTAAADAAAPSNAELAKQVAALQQQLQQIQQQDTINPHAGSTAPATSTSQQTVAANTVPGNIATTTRSILGTYVVTGPSVGIPSHYDGSNLIVTSPSINEDYALLQRTALAMQELQSHGYTLSDSPHLVLSGALEGQAYRDDPYYGSYTSNVDLTRAELDTYIEVTSWFSGYMAFAYDNSPPSQSADAVSNSRLYLDKGFITVGNLNKSPVYSSLGQYYVSFGRYSGITISDPLTKYLGRTKARAITVGVHPNMQDTFYAEVFAFRGATTQQSTHDANRVNQGGADLGLAYGDSSSFNGNLGASYISTIADSQGMLSNGYSAPNFNGFDDSNHLNSRVPAYDAHFSGGYGPFTLLAEYIATTNRFSSQNLIYDNKGAAPTAADVEANLSFNVMGHPSTVALVYDETTQALALDIPKQRYMVDYQIAVAQDTLLTFEYRHDVNYGKSATAYGQGNQAYVSNELGQTSNAVAAQIGIYF